MKTLLIDTRQQAGKHDSKHDYFKSIGVPMLRSKLPCGDYALMQNLSAVIDSKASIQEVIGNICGKQHERFRRELLLARDNEIKLFVLVENEDSIKCIDDLRSWNNPRIGMQKWITTPSGERRKVLKYPTATRGEALAKAMKTMQERYGVEFLFCAPEESGRKILELLKVEV